MKNLPTKNRGFTLLEFAVVLAVIGLLVGAVIGGNSLMKQSELQSVLSDYSRYTTAVAQFRQQYGGLPGDLLDATNFWGDDNANCADAAVTDGTPGTCNGDGDADMSDATSAVRAEAYRAWQHLMLAKYIEGNFTGSAGGGGNTHSVIGTNVPKSRIQGAGWSFSYKAATAANAAQYDQELLNFLAFGKSVTNGLTQAAVITPSDAWQVDTKVDNGMPGTGRVVTLKTTQLANCATSDTDATATYNRTYTSPACSLNMSLTLK